MKAFPHNPTIFWRTPKIFGYILAFLSFLTLTFLTVKFFAPDVNSDAATKNISAGSTTAGYTLSAGFEDSVSIPVTPTSSQAVYSANHAVTITNGCTAGATLTMTSNSTTSNALTRTGSDSGVKTIATTTGTTALDNNSWGYSLDNGTNYAGIPLKNGTAATIYSGSTAGSKTVNVLYGVKTDNNLPSGTYTTDVVYTAAVSPSCLTYTVHFDTDGGTTFPDLTLNYGDKINLTNYIPTKSGYVFAGYSNGTSTFTGTETAADLNPSNAFAVTLSSTYCAQVYNFDYTGGEQAFTAPCNGYYKLEVWGAQGGTTHSSKAIGGYGAYSVGVYNTSKNTQVYVNVGQQGTIISGNTEDETNMYNGGGGVFWHWSAAIDTEDRGKGGGATHIATVSGQLGTLSNYKDTGGINISKEILIVSGGGAGGQYFNNSDTGSYSYCHGANAGGIQGNVTRSHSTDGKDVYNKTVVNVASSQTSGGSITYKPGWGDTTTMGDFGQASGAYSGGGGGWYGGTTGYTATIGGSGYIGSSNLISSGEIAKHMTCYSCTTSSVAATRTYSNTNVSATATADYSKIGNGYARITYLGTSI